MPKTYDVLECFERLTPLGGALLVRIHRVDMAPMPWTELAELVNERYPGRYALQLIPPKSRRLDQANKYHVWVLSEPRAGNPFDLVET